MRKEMSCESASEFKKSILTFSTEFSCCELKILRMFLSVCNKVSNNKPYSN
jgi:hypothetical protein